MIFLPLLAVTEMFHRIEYCCPEGSANWVENPTGAACEKSMSPDAVNGFPQLVPGDPGHATSTVLPSRSVKLPDGAEMFSRIWSSSFCASLAVSLVTLVSWAKRSSKGNNMANPRRANARSVCATSVSTRENPAPLRVSCPAGEGASTAEQCCLVWPEWLEWSRLRPSRAGERSRFQFL